MGRARSGAMVSVLQVVLLVGLVAAHTLAAAVMTRFFRLRLETDWGTAVYAVTLVPIVLLVSTLVFTGPFGIGVDLGSAGAVFAVLVFIPGALGAAVDFLYVEPPEEYELPDVES